MGFRGSEVQLLSSRPPTSIRGHLETDGPFSLPRGLSPISEPGICPMPDQSGGLWAGVVEARRMLANQGSRGRLGKGQVGRRAMPMLGLAVRRPPDHTRSDNGDKLLRMLSRIGWPRSASQRCTEARRPQGRWQRRKHSRKDAGQEAEQQDIHHAPRSTGEAGREASASDAVPCARQRAPRPSRAPWPPDAPDAASGLFICLRIGLPQAILAQAVL